MCYSEENDFRSMIERSNDDKGRVKINRDKMTAI